MDRKVEVDIEKNKFFIAQRNVATSVFHVANRAFLEMVSIVEEAARQFRSRSAG